MWYELKIPIRILEWRCNLYVNEKEKLARTSVYIGSRSTGTKLPIYQIKPNFDNVCVCVCSNAVTWIFLWLPPFLSLFLCSKHWKLQYFAKNVCHSMFWLGSRKRFIQYFIRTYVRTIFVRVPTRALTMNFLRACDLFICIMAVRQAGLLLWKWFMMKWIQWKRNLLILCRTYKILVYQ